MKKVNLNSSRYGVGGGGEKCGHHMVVWSYSHKVITMIFIMLSLIN